MGSEAEDFAAIYKTASNILYNIDVGNLDAAMADMSDDVRLTLGDQSASGADDVRLAISRSRDKGNKSRHMLTNLRLRKIDSQQTAASSVILVTVDRPDRRAITTCEYEDVFIQNGEGRFILSERSMLVVNALVFE